MPRGRCGGGAAAAWCVGGVAQPAKPRSASGTITIRGAQEPITLISFQLKPLVTQAYTVAFMRHR